MNDKMTKALKTATSEMAKLLGTNKGLVVQIMDMSIFKETKDSEEISDIIIDNLNKNYNQDFELIHWMILDNLIIGFGLAITSKKEIN